MNIGGQISSLDKTKYTARENVPMSQMPPGLTADLTLDEFTALIEYLVSLK